MQRKYDLVIAGYPREKKYYESLQSLVIKKGINNKVIFTGGVNHKEVAGLYQNAFLFVYPSHYETFGLTILEAMACGCPVIASNTSSIPEIGGDAALYFNPTNPYELKKIMTAAKFLNV